MSDLNAIIDLKTNDNVKNVRGRRKKGIGERKQCMDIERKKGKKKEGNEDKRKGKNQGRKERGKEDGIYLAVQWLRLCAFTAGGTGSI